MHFMLCAGWPSTCDLAGSVMRTELLHRWPPCSRLLSKCAHVNATDLPVQPSADACTRWLCCCCVQDEAAGLHGAQLDAFLTEALHRAKLGAEDPAVEHEVMQYLKQASPRCQLRPWPCCTVALRCMCLAPAQVLQSLHGISTSRAKTSSSGSAEPGSIESTASSSCSDLVPPGRQASALALAPSADQGPVPTGTPTSAQAESPTGGHLVLASPANPPPLFAANDPAFSASEPLPNPQQQQYQQQPGMQGWDQGRPEQMAAIISAAASAATTAAAAAVAGVWPGLAFAGVW